MLFRTYDTDDQDIDRNIIWSHAKIWLEGMIAGLISSVGMTYSPSMMSMLVGVATMYLGAMVDKVWNAPGTSEGKELDDELEAMGMGPASNFYARLLTTLPIVVFQTSLQGLLKPNIKTDIIGKCTAAAALITSCVAENMMDQAVSTTLGNPYATGAFPNNGRHV